MLKFCHHGDSRNRLVPLRLLPFFLLITKLCHFAYSTKLCKFTVCRNSSYIFNEVEEAHFHLLSERLVQLLGWLQVQSLRTVAVLVSNPSFWLFALQAQELASRQHGRCPEDDSKRKEIAFHL